MQYNKLNEEGVAFLPPLWVDIQEGIEDKIATVEE
jgi:hypothetical protein